MTKSVGPLDINMRFSNAGEARRWNDMYSTDTERLDELNFRKRRDLAVDYVLRQLPDGGRVLDMGCGAGPVITRLRKHGITCIGLEQSADMLEHARARLRSHNLDADQLYQQDCRKTTFDDETFDIIVCLGVISYIKDYEEVLQEIKRLLKPGCVAIISFRNLFSSLFFDPIGYCGSALKTFVLRTRPQDKFVEGRYLDFREFRNHMQRLGFKFLDFVGIGFGPIRLAGKKLFSGRRSIKINNSIDKHLSNLGWRSPYLWLTDVSIWVYQKDDAEQ